MLPLRLLLPVESVTVAVAEEEGAVPVADEEEMEGMDMVEDDIVEEGVVGGFGIGEDVDMPGGGRCEIRK